MAKIKDLWDDDEDDDDLFGDDDDDLFGDDDDDEDKNDDDDDFLFHEEEPPLQRWYIIGKRENGRGYGIFGDVVARTKEEAVEKARNSYLICRGFATDAVPME